MFDFPSAEKNAPVVSNAMASSISSSDNSYSWSNDNDNDLAVLPPGDSTDDVLNKLPEYQRSRQEQYEKTSRDGPNANGAGEDIPISKPKVNFRSKPIKMKKTRASMLAEEYHLLDDDTYAYESEVPIDRESPTPARGDEMEVDDPTLRSLLERVTASPPPRTPQTTTAPLAEAENVVPAGLDVAVTIPPSESIEAENEPPTGSEPETMPPPSEFRTGSDLDSICSPHTHGSCRWVREGEEFLRQYLEGDLAHALISHWVEFECRMCLLVCTFGSIWIPYSHLSYKANTKQRIHKNGRPEQIDVWLRYGRKFKKEKLQLVDSVTEYADDWLSWYRALQPKGPRQEFNVLQTSARGKIDVSADWSELKKGGANGFFMILVSLVLWSLALETEEQRALFDTALHDVDWVLRSVTGSLGIAQSKRGNNGGSLSSRQKRRRI